VDNIVVQLATPLPPHAPPLALGGSFYQLAGQPLAINIADLMAFDYDPDGEPVFFVGTSVNTSNGLPLTIQGTQILVPTNSLADSFSYTIVDEFGTNATGTATISIITSPTSQANTLDLSVPGEAFASFTGVPWYHYQCQRATNTWFTGTLMSWPVQAWADGSIFVWDNFADLSGKPTQAFYRLRFTP
jgi:hypothetical protein